MNILFIVPYVPSLIRVRAYNFIRALTARGHKVSVMTLYTTETEREDADRLSELCHAVYALPLSRWRSLRNSLKAVPASTPLQVDYCWQPDLAQAINHILTDGHADGQHFDVIHVEHLRGVRYALYADRLAASNGKPTPPVIWDSVDCISLLFREGAGKSQDRKGRTMARFELKRTEKYEAWIANQLAHIVLTSPHDKEHFLSLLSPQNAIEKENSINVVPNGVDLDYFNPYEDGSREPATLVVTGKMSYHANIAMVLNLVTKIMPLVWEVRPDTQLMVVGKDPGKEIQELAGHPQITVTGTVDDIRPYLRFATAAVAPTTYGAGIQNKVLEAMACGTPVIASTIAVSALKVVASRDLLVADNPAEFASSILHLLENPTMGQTLGRNGRLFVEKNHDWVKLTANLERIYQCAIEEIQWSTMPA